MSNDKKGGKAALAFVLVPVLAIVAIPFAIIGFLLLAVSAAGAVGCAPGSSEALPSSVLDSEQAQNAVTIMGVAKAGFTDPLAQQQAAVVGLITALQESQLRNIDYGDRDSVGLFQQRPSMGWGSVEDIMSPPYAAGRFYKALHLLAEWATLSPGAAAQAVQVSAFPDEYAKHLPVAEAAVAELFASAAPVSIPPAVGWAGQDGSVGNASINTGGCISTGEIGLPLPEGYGISDGYGPRGEIPGLNTGSFHPAVDLVADCGTPIYAMASGAVTESDSLFYTVTSPSGFEISYLHTSMSSRIVPVGGAVATGQQIAAVGNEPPSTGCHLDVRIKPGTSTDPRVSALVPDPSARGYVNPLEFTRAFGVELCPPEWCHQF